MAFDLIVKPNMEVEAKLGDESNQDNLPIVIKGGKESM